MSTFHKKKKKYNDHFSAQKTTMKVPGEGSGLYGLVGVVLHKQLTSGLGHYTAFVRSPSDNCQWYNANDSQVLCCIHHECTTSVHIDYTSGDPSQCCYCGPARTCSPVLQMDGWYKYKHYI